MGKDKLIGGQKNKMCETTEPTVTNKPYSRTYSKSTSNIRSNKPLESGNKRVKINGPGGGGATDRCSRRSVPGRKGNKETVLRSLSNNMSGCSSCDNVSRSRSRRERSKSSESLRNLSDSESKRRKASSRSRSGSRTRGRGSKGDFLEELLDSAKSPVKGGAQKKSSLSSYDAKKAMFNQLYPDQPTLFDKYLVI
jgi:hypothetical protein